MPSLSMNSCVQMANEKKGRRRQRASFSTTARVHVLISVSDNNKSREKERLYLCKRITLCDVVLDPVHLQVHADVQVFPPVALAAFILGQSLPFEPFSLRYPGVLHQGLEDAHAVVLQVVVDDHGAHAAHVLRGKPDLLLKVRVEAQHLRGKG